MAGIDRYSARMEPQVQSLGDLDLLLAERTCRKDAKGVRPYCKCDLGIAPRNDAKAAEADILSESGRNNWKLRWDVSMTSLT
jgi:hypothetical protein